MVSAQAYPTPAQRSSAHARAGCPAYVMRTLVQLSEGTEEDYILSDLQAVNFEYNLFSGQSASRRLQAAEAVYAPLVPTLTAVSHS